MAQDIPSHTELLRRQYRVFYWAVPISIVLTVAAWLESQPRHILFGLSLGAVWRLPFVIVTAVFLVYFVVSAWSQGYFATRWAVIDRQRRPRAFMGYLLAFAVLAVVMLGLASAMVFENVIHTNVG